MKFLIFFILSIFLIGCIKEKTGITYSFIKNNTSHNIKLLPYNGSVIDNANMVSIAPNVTKEVCKANVKGKTIEPCLGTLLQPYDSVLVVYDDVYKIPHIKFNTIYNGPRKVLFNSNRSISNASNWIKTITNETKNSIEGNFLFTFVEQDYLDAKL